MSENDLKRERESDMEEKSETWCFLILKSVVWFHCVCACVSPDVIGRWSVRACPVSLVERSESCDLQEAVGGAEREKERDTR